jgi:hypothetical protein
MYVLVIVLLIWSQSLRAEFKASADSAASLSTAAATGRTESVDFLQDLRSKLLITDIPAELEAEHAMSAKRDAFVTGFQVHAIFNEVLLVENRRNQK